MAHMRKPHIRFRRGQWEIFRHKTLVVTGVPVLRCDKFKDIWPEYLDCMGLA